MKYKISILDTVYCLKKPRLGIIGSGLRMKFVKIAKAFEMGLFFSGKKVSWLGVKAIQRARFIEYNRNFLL